jgi:simple sugar transport system permease protein
MTDAMRLNLSLLSLLLALSAGFALALGFDFVRVPTFQSIAFQLPELGLLSLAMMVAMLSGGIDLSIVAIANLASLAAATALANSGAGAFAVVGGPLLGLAVAALAGAINGGLIAWGGISPILATLSTMILYGGLALGLSHGGVITGFPPAVLSLGNGAVAGVPAPLFIFAATALFVDILLRATPFGVAVRMIGSNEAATRYSGVDTPSVLLRVYLLSGALAGIAGLVMLARFNSAKAGTGDSYLLQTILAAVLGGVDPNGGRGQATSLILALLILQVIASGLNLLEVSAFLTLFTWGAVLLLVIARPGIAQMMLRRRERAS